MAKLLPYFRWFPADAESDSNYAAMNLAELGLFHRCLNHAWLNDGLPVDGAEIARVLRVSVKDFMKSWPRVSQRFQGVDRLRNSRQEEEREYANGKSKQASSAVRARESRRWGDVSGDVSGGHPRAYGSVSVSESESVFESSEEIRKTKVAEVLARGLAPIDKRLTVEELETAWERHRKHRNDQPMVNVFRMVHAQNGTLDSDRFRDRHPRWCEYWNRRDWSFCPLTLWEWIEQGMPLPPPEATALAGGKSQESPSDRMIRVMNERAKKEFQEKGIL